MKTKAFFICRFFVAFLSLFCVSCAGLASFFGDGSGGGSPFTNAEAVDAMKAALNVGIGESSDVLSNAATGYYERSAENGYAGEAALKILLPDEATKVLDNIDKILQYVDVSIMDELIENVVLGLNRSAEDAAKEVVPIFSKAITDMTVADGIEIVCGEEDAATEYLKTNTYDQLLELYSGKIDESLDKPLLGSISTNEAWAKLENTYNTAAKKYNDAISGNIITGSFLTQIPLLDVDISDHATRKALDGLFHMVAQEEAEIRENPLDYASDVIQKVFGAVKAGLVP